jgi:hypothetical protein
VTRNDDDDDDDNNNNNNNIDHRGKKQEASTNLREFSVPNSNNIKNSV